MISSSQTIHRLDSGWTFVTADPDAFEHPSELLTRSDLEWMAAEVPGTVASSLRALNSYSIDEEHDFDSSDYWFRCVFSIRVSETCDYRLRFGGLATIADVWLNGSHILTSENMFVGHTCQVMHSQFADPGEANELWIRFASLNSAMEVRRPRAKWRVGLVSHRNLRFYRTTLLGRMPGICPPVAPVGPWRSIEIVEERLTRVEHLDLRPRLEGSDGVVEVSLRISGIDKLALGDVSRAEFKLDELAIPLAITKGDLKNSLDIQGELRIPDVTLWWPHTHGDPHRYDARLELTVCGQELSVRVPPVGFRKIELDGPPGSKFSIKVNGLPVFCRGSNWTPLDLVSLCASTDELKQSLEVVCDAGMNMLRLNGTTIYESDEFYGLCDAMGILVWQDFMFARMDYPIDEKQFFDSIAREASDLLARICHRPSICVLCGNSEVQQQAAMTGLPPEVWTNRWFEKTLPALCEASQSDSIYCSSSPNGGSLPFHMDSGVSHYFGVGGYLRPIEDARLSEPQFASECLAFSNVPESETLDSMFSPGVSILGSTLYDERIPKDAGLIRDFGEATDHYIRALYAADIDLLKSQDEKKYLSLARAAVGEVMAYVQSYWRRKNSVCAGALILFHQDYWRGSGWGVVDSRGVPKAPYFYLKRVWSPLALLVLDGGLDGVRIHLINDREYDFEGRIAVRFMRYDGTTVASTDRSIRCSRHAAIETPVESLIGTFMDSSYAYKFGPRSFDFIVTRLTGASDENADLGEVSLENIFHPLQVGLLAEADIGLRAEITKIRDGAYNVRISASQFGQTVSLSTPGYLASDNYFHLAPDRPRDIQLVQREIHTISDSTIVGVVCALNSSEQISLQV